MGGGGAPDVGERRGVYRVLVEKSEGRRLLERPRRRLEDNINWNFKK
jgi:glutathione peroxidase-family protein